MPNSSRIITGLPQFPEGVPPELYTYFFNVYQAIKNLADSVSKFGGIDEYDPSTWNQLTLDETLWPSNPRRWYVRQNEALLAGQVVSPILVGAEIQARLANATDNTRWACGIVSSQDHVSVAGSFCEVTIGDGLINGISGMIAGARYWVDVVNGQIRNVPAVAFGNIEQYAGWAISSNRLVMNLSGNFIQH